MCVFLSRAFRHATSAIPLFNKGVGFAESDEQVPSGLVLWG